MEGEKFQHERIEQRAQLGFIPQARALYEELSGEENLRLFGLTGKTLRDA